ncbi:MAG: hypothetical protein ACOC91_00180 [bacterium]
MRRGAAGALALLGLTGILFAFAGNAAGQTVPPTAPPTVEAQPPNANVPVTRTATVRVTWVVTNTTSDPILSINSPGAQGSFSGPNESGSLAFPQPLTHGPVNPGATARLSETLVLPQSFLTRVLQAGTRTVLVQRPFEIATATTTTGQPITINGQMEIDITGSLGAELQISRIDLRFQNEAVQIIVPQHHPPEVRADITYTGTGLFRAVWEIADPRVTAAGGNPIFRPLRQERIRLGVGGFTRVKGPQLTADLTGLHIVRFRVLDGPLRGEAPVVRYFVKAAEPDGEDWWKRYLRPHREGEGMIRVPEEPAEGEVPVEETPPEHEDDEGEPGEDGEPGGGGDPGQ